MLPSSSRNGGPEAPATLADQRSLATGALVATLVAHRRDWVRLHSEWVELWGAHVAQREATVGFELPAIAWALPPDGMPALVPLALVPKSAAGDVAVRDEAGAPVDLLAQEKRAEIAASGLLALAQSAGAERDDLRSLAWQIAAGTPEEAAGALAALARGDSLAARLAWMHGPFRELAQRLADSSILVVALHDAKRPRTLVYRYSEPLPMPDGVAAPAANGRPARYSGWATLRARLPLPHLDDAPDHRLVIDAGPRTNVSSSLDETSRSAEVHAAPAATRAVRLAPLVALLGAALLAAESVAAPAVANRSTWLSPILLVPAAVAAFLARRPKHPLARELLHGWRRLLFYLVALCLAGQVVLAVGASKSVLRPAAGLLAIGALVVVVLLLETWRRALGRPPTELVPRVTHPAPPGDGRRLDPTRVALVAAVMAAGLMVVALGDATARAGGTGARALVWAGLLAIFLPAVVHAWRGPPRSEALAGVILLGVALYLVKVLNSPLGFTFHDEFSTLRTTLDIERFGHLFAHNPLIGVHPSYPGLELATSGVSSITGLSMFTSGLIVLGLLRVALMAALFLAFESVVARRTAALATVLYACNPNFVFFDSQWAYESFALPLALAVIAMAARGTRTAWLSVPLVLALCVSHPLTSMALVAFLVVWAAIDALLARRDGQRPRRHLWVLAAVGAIGTAAWTAFVARGLGGYLGPVLGEAGNSMIDLLLGESAPKRIFGAVGVPGNPLVERLFGFGSVFLALVAIWFGARRLWKRFTPLGGALGVVALAYPLSLPLRLTEAGTEISNRASEFVFTGVALLAALALTERMPAVSLRLRRRLTVPVVSALAATALIGGVVVGTAPWSRVPGHYRVAADETSVEPEGLRAAAWARSELGAGNRIFTDRINGLLMGSIGLQDPQVGLVYGVPLQRVLTGRTVDDLVRSVLAGGKIRYLVVDKRLSTGLPAVGFYFDPEEAGAYRHKRPLDLGALLKYDTLCPVARVFDSGNLVVYDTGRMALGRGC